jgi:hypothetical protein
MAGFSVRAKENFSRAGRRSEEANNLRLSRRLNMNPPPWGWWRD